MSYYRQIDRVISYIARQGQDTETEEKVLEALEPELAEVSQFCHGMLSDWPVATIASSKQCKLSPGEIADTR